MFVATKIVNRTLYNVFTPTRTIFFNFTLIHYPFPAKLQKNSDLWQRFLVYFLCVNDLLRLLLTSLRADNVNFIYRSFLLL